MLTANLINYSGSSEGKIAGKLDDTTIGETKENDFFGKATYYW